MLLAPTPLTNSFPLRGLALHCMCHLLSAFAKIATQFSNKDTQQLLKEICFEKHDAGYRPCHRKATFIVNTDIWSEDRLLP